ncbi:MAG: hypothetical protein M3083_19410 [Actinomycetota bacterium]|nr:hypothetical protein [Actinomycetota bacterium]
MSSDGAAIPTGQHVPTRSPPWFVQVERRLGLPVPLAWRSWVAHDLLSDEWAGRVVGRRRWIRAHRTHLIVAIVVFQAAVVIVTFTTWSSFSPSVSYAALTPVLAAVIRSRATVSDDEMVSLTRWNSLHWNGLRLDGSLDPSTGPHNGPGGAARVGGRHSWIA